VKTKLEHSMPIPLSLEQLEIIRDSLIETAEMHVNKGTFEDAQKRAQLKRLIRAEIN
jgi:hypothetical protein